MPLGHPSYFSSDDAANGGRLLDRSVARVAIRLTYATDWEQMMSKDLSDAWIWGPLGAATVVTDRHLEWSCTYWGQALSDWLDSPDGSRWRGEKTIKQGLEKFEKNARHKIATLAKSSMVSSSLLLAQGAPFLAVGDCLWQGAVYFPEGFYVATSGFTGEADEWFSRKVGENVNLLCSRIQKALLAMDHEGFITAEMLDEARTSVLKSFRPTC